MTSLFAFTLAFTASLGADGTLRDSAGRERRLEEWERAPLVVLAFLSVDCPVARFYAGRLQEIQKELAAHGVVVVGVAANAGDGLAALGDFEKTLQLSYPLLCDDARTLVRRFGVKRTPEVVVLDRQRKVRYQGRVDDQVIPGERRANATRADLRCALTELLAGQQVRIARTEASGCPLEVVEAAPAASVIGYRDVAPILNRRCVGCHRPGGIGPFTLTNAAAATRRARAIGEAVASRRMPPWHADPKHGRFANDPSLTEAERKTVAAWVAGGAAAGEVRPDAPAALPSSSAWQMSEPHQIVKLPRPQHVPADGIVDYQFVEVDPGLTADAWVQEAEVRPTNRAVTHHVTVFLKPPGATDAVAQGELASFCLCAYAMGTPPMRLPDGMAKKLPAGWRLLFVLHYVTNGTPQTDQTELGLRFLDPEQVRREVATNLLNDPDFTIPPHAADVVVARSRTFSEAVHLLALFPHMHLRGKSFRYEAAYPDGRREILLSVPAWDMAWQHRYELAAPKLLPAGTVLTATAQYDNSSANPRNPDPNATVLAGPRTEDEMFNGYYDFCLADPDAPRWANVPWLRKPATWCVVLSLLLLLQFARRPRA